MYYIYKIENLVNHKKYIGLTDNIQRRRNRHFTDLNCNRHDNQFLQKEFNVYGKENFSFEKVFEGDVSYQEISDLEKKYIKQYDSYLNGYNQNEGGNFGPSNGGSKLIQSDIFNILAVCEYMSRPGQILSDIFEISKTTVMRIKKGVNHCQSYEAYYAMTQEQRKEIFDIFCESYNLEEWLAKNHGLHSQRKLSKEQCFMAIANHKYQIMSSGALSRKINIHQYIISEAAKGNTYKDWYMEFNKLSEEDQKYYASLLSNE